jgi:hypothetical protein
MLRLMDAGIPERDWKVFRELRTLALERLCQKALSEIAHVSVSPETAHQKYLRIFKIIHERDDEIAAMFNNPRRSTAWEQLCMIRAAGLLNDEEMLRFSPDTQESVRVFVAHLTKRCS